MLFSLGPSFSVFIDSLLDKTALLIWPDAFYPVQRPETIPGRMVGGLYTGNVAELLHLYFLKTHVSFRGRMGKSGLAGGNPYFPGDALTHISFGCRVQSHFGSFLHSGVGDFPTQSLGFVVMGIGGSIPRSDVLFLTLEMNTLGFRALTCLIFMVEMTPSLF